MSYQNCHNCGSLWSPGSEEYDWQQCSSCGWTPGDPIEEDEVDPDDFDDIGECEIDPELLKEFVKKVSGSVLDQGLPNRFKKDK